MKLKQYIENLQKLAKENPESLDMDVVYAADDEGNGYQKVVYAPTLGNLNGDFSGEFYSVESLREDGEEEEDYPINAVCIN